MQLARMPTHHIPKVNLFSWLPQALTSGGPRRKWRDLTKWDLKAAGIPEHIWYGEALIIGSGIRFTIKG